MIGHRLVWATSGHGAWCECPGPVWWGAWSREEIEAKHREHLVAVGVPTPAEEREA